MFSKAIIAVVALVGFSSQAFAWKIAAGKVSQYWTLENGSVFIQVEGANFMCRLNDNPEVRKQQLAVVQLAVAGNKSIGVFCYDEQLSPTVYPHHMLHRIDLHP